MDKHLSKCFPDRKYSEIEAAFSLTLDYDNNKTATIAGYSKLWGWSRSKVRNFLSSMGVELIYLEDLSKKQNQKGQIKIQIEDRSETDRGQIRMIDTKASQGDKDRSETDEGQIKDRSKNTTNKPTLNTNTKPNIKKTSVTSDYSEAFERWWVITPKRQGRRAGKKEAYQLFKLIPVSEYIDLKKATLNYKKNDNIRDPCRFLKSDYWKDFIEDAEPFEEQNRFEKKPTTLCKDLVAQMPINSGEPEKPVWDMEPEIKLINQG